MEEVISPPFFIYIKKFKKIIFSESSQINKWRTKTLGLRPLTGGTLDIIERQDCLVINAYTSHLIPGNNLLSPLSFRPYFATCHITFHPPSTAYFIHLDI
jgi:hypothetical protein